MLKANFITAQEAAEKIQEWVYIMHDRNEHWSVQ